MKRETLDKDSFRMFSWVFISSLGSNLPLPVVSSGMTIPWHRAAGQNLSSYIIMLLEQFMTDFVTLTCITSLHWVLLRFSHTYINQSLFMGGHRAVPTPSGCLMTHGLLLWHLQTHPRSDTSPMICWSASPEHTHGPRTYFWHFQQLSTKRKKHPG